MALLSINRSTPLRFLLSLTLIFFLLLTVSSRMVSADRIVVGDRQRWTSGVNYTAWAESRRFYVGDWLVFYWEKGMYDVLEVNATDYEHCTAINPLWNGTLGGKNAYLLRESRQYYFICSTGHCWDGMKMTFFAEPLPLPSPSPQRSDARSWATVDLRLGVLLLALTFVFGLF